MEPRAIEDAGSVDLEFVENNRERVLAPPPQTSHLLSRMNGCPLHREKAAAQLGLEKRLGFI